MFIFLLSFSYNTPRSKERIKLEWNKQTFLKIIAPKQQPERNHWFIAQGLLMLLIFVLQNQAKPLRPACLVIPFAMAGYNPLPRCPIISGNWSNCRILLRPQSSGSWRNMSNPISASREVRPEPHLISISFATKFP